MAEALNHSSPPTGGCACGAVTYTIQFHGAVSRDILQKASICHCTMCSAWSGGIFTYVEIYPHEGTVTWDGLDQLRVWKSSEFAERGFCKVCGSSLFCRVTMSGPMQGMYHIGAGTLTHHLSDDNNAKTHPVQTIHDQFFVDRKPSAYSFHGTGKQMTSTEFFALWES